MFFTYLYCRFSACELVCIPLVMAVLFCGGICLAEDGHNNQTTSIPSHNGTHPEAPTKSQTKKAFTGYLGSCMLNHARRMMFKDSNGGWYTALESKKKDEAGEFRNIDGDTVVYEKGDYLVKLPTFGWFKAKDCPDLSGQTTELDPRCRWSQELNTKDKVAVAKHNKQCGIEWESLRYTVAKRLAIAPNQVWSEQNIERLEREMNQKWDPDFSFFMRARAREMVNTGLANAHGGDLHGPVNKFNSLIAPKGKFTLSGAPENAWPTWGQGRTVDEIAYNITSSTATASDGNMMGLNYHPGHAQNVMSGCDVIGVGIHLDELGNTTAYFQFSTKFRK